MHVKALVAAGLRMFDVILDGNNRQIILFADHLRQTVDIRGKGTDNTDSRDVINIIYHILNGTFISISFQLLDNAFRCLDPLLNVLNGIVFMYVNKLVIENVKLRADLL